MKQTLKNQQDNGTRSFKKGDKVIYRHGGAVIHTEVMHIRRDGHIVIRKGYGGVQAWALPSALELDKPTVPKELDVNVWMDRKRTFVVRAALCDGTPVQIAPLEAACVLASQRGSDAARRRAGGIGGNRLTGGGNRFFLWLHPGNVVTYSRVPRTEATVKRTVADIERSYAVEMAVR